MASGTGEPRPQVGRASTFLYFSLDRSKSCVRRPPSQYFHEHVHGGLRKGKGTPPPKKKKPKNKKKKRGRKKKGEKKKDRGKKKKKKHEKSEKLSPLRSHLAT